MASKKLTKAQLAAELRRRQQVNAGATITPELLADGHPMQLAIIVWCLANPDKNLVLQCSRRAGKTWLCLCILLLTALGTNNVTGLYLGLTGSAAEEQWFVWLRLLDSLGIAAQHVDMRTTFENGSRVEFGGLDDIRHVQSLRGRNLSGGCVVIDEAQSDPGVIKTTVEDILGPMLDETTVEHPLPGRLIIAGTIPELEGVGYFEKTWLDNVADPESLWGCFHWGRADNPHETNFEKNLQRYLKKYGYTIDHPHVRRTWFGERVFGDADTAYGWSPKNSYTPTPPPWLQQIADEFPPGQILAAELPRGVRFLSVGVDPGTRDEATVEVLAWGEPGAGVWHVFEWATPKNAGATQGDWAAVLGEVKRRYPGLPIRFVYDAGSSQEVIDTFARDYGIGAVLPAKKAALKGQVDRFKTLLRRGDIHVMAGSMLERDVQSTRWDLDARDRGQWKFTNVYHPSGSESARYALDYYFEVKAPPAAPKYANEVEAEAARVEAWVRERFSQPITRKNARPSLWGGPRRAA